MISKDKQYRTRDGREVRIYATDGGPTKDRIHGDVKEQDGWGVRSWNKYGLWVDSQSGYHPSDLIEVKPRIKREYWVNVYDRCISGHRTKYAADDIASYDRIACVKVEIDCEEGEGL